MQNKVKILLVEKETHNVKKFIIEKPKGFNFIPGQATDLVINDKKWIKEKRPFTFTSLNEDDVLEFTIKGYYERNGVTNKLHQLKAGDELIIEDPFGAIQYNGKGVFIAGGAGITPFIAIIKELTEKGKIKGNTLIFSNKKHEDIILERFFKDCLGENCIFTLTDEKKEGYENRRIDENFLKEKIKNFKQKFYICGPPKFVEDIKNILIKLGAKADTVVFEK